MAKVVFILGAGASAESGVPLMDNFIDEVRNLYANGYANDKDYKTVLDAIGKLQAIASKADIDIKNIEKVYSTLEMAKIINCFGSYTEEEIDSLLNSFRSMITKTIQQKMKFPLHKNELYPRPTSSYLSFAHEIKRYREFKEEKNEIAIITFNYDIGIDFALHYKNVLYDYCLHNNSIGKVPLLKLHGSLNWGLCSECSEIIPYELRTFFNKYSFPRYGPNKTSATITMSDRLSDLSHHGKSLSTVPYFVPPTWNKLMHYQESRLANVWRRAAQELRTAQYIFVIGYSLPASDEFFKNLYALGTMGDNVIRKFCVVNPAPAVNEKYERLLGPIAKKEYRFLKIGFSDSIKEIFEIIS